MTGVSLPLTRKSRIGSRADVLIAPLPKGVQRGEEVRPLLRQPVFEPRWTLAVQRALEDPLIDKPSQTLVKDVRGNTEAVSKRPELRQPEEGVTDQEPGPAVPYDLERPRD